MRLARGATLVAASLSASAALSHAHAQIAARDDAGVEVSLTAPARRIVALAPSQAELVDAAGAGRYLVGVSSMTDLPVHAAQLPVVAGPGRVDFERLVQLVPDLIVAWQSGNTARDVARLRQRGMVVFVTEPRRITDIPRLIRALGVLAATAAHAEVSARGFEQSIAMYARPLQAKVPVFVAIWHAPLITINDEHLIADVLRLCGAANVFAALPVLAPRVSREQLLVANPRLIIAGGNPSDRDRVLRDWAPFRNIAAVQNGHVAVIDPQNFHRQGPGITAGVRAVCDAVAAAAG